MDMEMEFSVVEQIFGLLPELKILAATALLTTTIYLVCKPRCVYLVDFMCYRDNDVHRIPISTFIEHGEIMEKFDRAALDFQTKVLERAGIGNESYVPTSIHMLPPDHTLEAPMAEVRTVLFTVVRNLFTKHNINPKSIDILITNCSLFCPTPSFSSMIINEFGFRSNIMSFSLSGMGCSAGILSISLAQDLLKVHKNSLALVLSMESISSNVYGGKAKSMILANCLFRMGGAAILLSNRNQDKDLAKYKLENLVRTHLGSRDGSYNCVVQEEDDEGHVGVTLAKSIVKEAGEALKRNLAVLAALSLPYSEQSRYVMSVLKKKFSFPRRRRGKGVPYMPDFTKAFDHFCIHAGGRAVIEAIKESLGLKDIDVEASKMTLHRFGNTSSSSIWYSFSYLEAKGRIKRGDTVWQLGFGSGFKCNSVVWKCISKTKPESSNNVWSDIIHKYPVEVPEVTDH